jgi:large subunit ribosomal protein L1
MAKHGKKYQSAKTHVKLGVTMPVKEALAKLKEVAFAKFDESIDVSVGLGIDATKGEQAVRGSTLLPHGKGKIVRVIVFAKGEYAEAAKAAGADLVGAEDLVEKIENGWMEFDVAVATPDLMGLVGKLAKLLGPRGLLPNKKVGTVTLDVGPVISDLKKGRAFFKNDKSGYVNFSFGKKSFDVEKLHDNLVAFAKALASSKPASSKGKFLRKMTISSTMGLGITISPDEVLQS